jgi:hypothetical protein
VRRRGMCRVHPCGSAAACGVLLKIPQLSGVFDAAIFGRVPGLYGACDLRDARNKKSEDRFRSSLRHPTPDIVLLRLITCCVR